MTDRYFLEDNVQLLMFGGGLALRLCLYQNVKCSIVNTYLYFLTSVLAQTSMSSLNPPDWTSRPSCFQVSQCFRLFFCRIVSLTRNKPLPSCSSSVMYEFLRAPRSERLVNHRARLRRWSRWTWSRFKASVLAESSPGAVRTRSGQRQDRSEITSASDTYIRSVAASVCGVCVCVFDEKTTQQPVCNIKTTFI